MKRIDLPYPTSYHDMYMYDQCQSLRALVDALTPAAPPAPAADAVTELREPRPALTTRDALQAADAAAAVLTDAAPTGAQAGQGEAIPVQKVQSSTRRHPRAN